MADADANIRITATDTTAAAFGSVEKRLDMVARRTAESANKMAGVATFLGQNATHFQGMGKAAEVASVGISTLSMGMATFGGPGGILAAAVVGISAFILGSGQAAASTKDWSLRLSELQDNQNKVRLSKLRDELSDTEKEIKKLAGWSWKMALSSGEEIEAETASLRSAIEVRKELLQQIGQVDAQLAAGKTGSSKERSSEQAAQQAREQAMARFQAVEDGLLSEEQAINASYAKRLNDINVAEQMGLTNKQRADAMRLALAAQTEFKITQLQEQEAQRRAQIEQQYSQSVTAMRGQVLNAAVGFLRALPGAQKVAALAGIVIAKMSAITTAQASALASANLAYASQIIPGDPTSIARAQVARTAALAQGQATVGLITALSIGSGVLEAGNAMNGGMGGASGGSSGPLTAVSDGSGTSTTTPTVPTSGATPAKLVTINLGDENSLISKSSIRQLIEAINEEAGDNVRITFG